MCVLFNFYFFALPFSPLLPPSFHQSPHSTLTLSTWRWVRSHRLRAQSHQTALHFRYQFQVQAVACASDWVNQRFPQPPPWVWLICWSSSHNSGHWFTHCTSVLQRMLKGTNPQPDEGIHRVRSYPPERASVLWSLGPSTLAHGSIRFTHSGPLWSPSFGLF